MHPRLLVLHLLTLTLVLGSCGSSDEAPAGGSSAETPVDGGDALTWGSGDRGVVLAHGSAFDAASWEEQATAIAEQGATVVAVEDTSPDSIQAHAQNIFDTDQGGPLLDLILDRLAE